MNTIMKAATVLVCAAFFNCHSDATAQQAWIPYTGALPTGIWSFQAVSEDECVVLPRLYPDTPDQLLRLNARSGVSTALLRIKKYDRAVMHWLSRDTGVVILQQAIPRAVDAYWTFNAGRDWDSLSFLPSSVVYDCQITPWKRIYLSLGLGAIAAISTDTRTWNEAGTGIQEFWKMHYFDSLRIVGMQNRAIVRSEDGGKSWTTSLTFNPPQGSHNPFHCARDGALFLSANELTRRSIDSGRTWQELPAGPWALRQVLDAIGAHTFWGLGQRTLDSHGYHAGDQYLLSYSDNSGWDRLDDVGYLAEGMVPFSMWTEFDGWCLRGLPTSLQFTRSGGLRPRGITVTDFSTLHTPRVRVIFSHGRHGAWASAQLLRREAGALAWEQRATLPFPLNITWDEGLAAGKFYEFAVVAKYPDNSSSMLLSEAIACATPTLLDLEEYVVPQAGYQARYTVRRGGTGGVPVDTADVTWENTGRAESTFFAYTRLKELRTDWSGGDSTEAVLLLTRDENPGYRLHNSRLPWASMVDRFQRVDSIAALAPPDTFRIQFGTSGDYFYYGYTLVRTVGVVKSFRGAMSLTGGDHVYQFAQMEERTTGRDVPTYVEGPLLEAVFPNPCQSSGIVSISLDRESQAVLELHTLLGSRVSTIFDGTLQAGRQTIRLDRGRLASGVYMLRFRAGDVTKTSLLLLQ